MRGRLRPRRPPPTKRAGRGTLHLLPSFRFHSLAAAALALMLLLLSQEDLLAVVADEDARAVLLLLRQFFFEEEKRFRSTKKPDEVEQGPRERVEELFFFFVSLLFSLPLSNHTFSLFIPLPPSVFAHSVHHGGRSGTMRMTEGPQSASPHGESERGRRAELSLSIDRRRRYSTAAADREIVSSLLFRLLLWLAPKEDWRSSPLRGSLDTDLSEPNRKRKAWTRLPERRDEGASGLPIVAGRRKSRHRSPFEPTAAAAAARFPSSHAPPPVFVVLFDSLLPDLRSDAILFFF